MPAEAGASVDEIVVVAHKSERRLREVPASVTVLTREEIKDDLSATMADAFRYTPGVDHEGSGVRFGTEGINIRGIGGNRVALLVDGVPLGDQFGIGSFSNATRGFINAGLIQRAEVLHGPASALYGSSAIGGVIAVSTPDPVDIAGAGGRGANLLLARSSADDSLHTTGVIAAGDADGGWLLAGGLRDGATADASAVAEPVDRREYRRRTGLVKLITDDAAGRTWRAGFLHQDAAVATDLRSVLGTGRFSSTTALLGDDDYELDLLHAELEFGAPDAPVEAGVLRAWYGMSTVEQRTTDERAAAVRPVTADRRFLYEQRMHGIELNLQRTLRAPAAEHRLAGGLEYRRKRTEELRDAVETGIADGAISRSLLGEVFPLRDFPVTDTSEWGAYLEDSIALGDWTVVAALRADRYELSPRPDSVFTEDNPTARPVSVTESDVSPKLGVVHRLTDFVDVYLQYAHGFRAPPFEDANIGLDIPLFNVRAIPNPDLRSERSDGLDVGVRWRGPGFGLSAAVFRTRYRDFIETKVRLGPDPVSGRILFQSQNLSRARIEGIEAGGYLDLPGRLRAFTLDGSLYRARGENRVSGEAMNSVGPAQALLGLRWEQPDGRGTVRLQSTFTESWTERDESAGALFKPPGYAVVDLFVTRMLGDHATLRAGLMNLADRSYWYWSDVRGLAPDDPLLGSLSQPGRHLIVSLDATWQ